MNTETYPPETIAAVLDAPIHLARCAECDAVLRFRPLPSGNGFTQIDNLAEGYGIGEHGRPTCPNGHGEMELADDRLPIEEAFEHAAGQLDAEPQRLPYPVPPFNYEGVLHAICEKRHDIAKLEKKVSDRKELLKEAKDDLDQANAELGRMIDQFEQDERDRIAEQARREARAAAGHPEETNLVRCAWEEAHPGDQCPICSEGMNGETARDSSLHIDEAEKFLFAIETDAIIELLDDIRLSEDLVNSWSVEDRAAVKAWAKDREGPRPAILGTAHVAQNGNFSEAAPGDTYQECVECGARLVTVKTGGDEIFDPYPAGTLVGVDCPGAKEPARYAKRGKKAKR